MFDFLKKKEHTNSEDRSFDPLTATYNDSSLGTLAVGQNSNNVIVNVVSRRKIKKGECIEHSPRPQGSSQQNLCIFYHVAVKKARF